MKKLFCLSSIFLFSTALLAAEDCSTFDTPSEFVTCVVNKHQDSDNFNFTEESLTELLAEAELKEGIIEAISRPAEAKPWYDYRPIFVTDTRAKGGVEFWNKHEAILQRAEEQYGMPAELIVAVIGVETNYGRNIGAYRVIDSLTTLGFHYPPRAKFFRQELEAFLLLTQEEDIDPLEVKGSYAGAMGMPQFISSSYRHYAVDFSNSGTRNLFETEDAIGSIGAYFSDHGWQPNAPIALPATVTGDDYKAIEQSGLRPTEPLQVLIDAGVEPAETLAADQLANLITLEQKDAEEYWVGLYNFYVITRYNHSALYAMAVYQLSQEIASLR